MMNIKPKESTDFDVIGFGEVMLRLSPIGRERLSQCDEFERRAGGSELNVVSGISMLGLRTGIITKLPDNELGYFVNNKIRFSGVSDDYVVFDSDRNARIGLYYYENGVFPRKPSVIYDRRNSSITTIKVEEINPKVFSSTRVFHVSGISLALGMGVRQVVIELIKRFKEQGVVISFDVNYRANLWDEEEARTCVESIFPMVDILFVSEETSRRMLARAGTIEDIMRGYCKEYGISIVATTMRKVISPTKHSFSSKIYSYCEDRFYEEPGYDDIEVVDRIGSGDAYLSGVLYGLLKHGDLQTAVEYGNAMAAVKNTTPGDMPASTLREIQEVIKAHKSAGPSSEMNR